MGITNGAFIQKQLILCDALPAKMMVTAGCCSIANIILTERTSYTKSFILNVY
jgi:hypothetical protein